MTRYKYTCTSKTGLCIYGSLTFKHNITELNISRRDLVLDRIMKEVSKIAHVSQKPWDPFNIELIVKAQSEPKLK